MAKMTAEDRRFTAKLVSLIMTGVLVLVALLMYFNLAFGWFAQNEEVGGNGASVTAYHDDTAAEYTHYTYNAKLETADVYDDISDIRVPQYDLIFLQRNRFTPAVVRVALTGENDLPRSGTIALTIGRNLGIADDPARSSRLSDYFTSMMRMTIIKGASIYNADPTTLYTNVDNLPYGNSTLYEVVKEQTVNSATSNVFVTDEGSGDAHDYVKADSITLSIDYTAADWNGDTLNIYLYISYDKTLLTAYTIQDLDLSGDITSVGRVIELVNDLVTITASHS